MNSEQHWIDVLQLMPHPEGGYYKETYRSSQTIQVEKNKHVKTRNVCTAIFFLLRSHDCSMLHRIQSDELWHYHAGASLSLYVIHDNVLEVKVLGQQVEKGELLQVVIPAYSWFGARVNNANDYSLSSCTVSPGFDFEDFELAERAVLIKQFPQYKEVIEMLTSP